MLCRHSSAEQNKMWCKTQDLSGEDFIVALADSLFHGDTERAGQRLLKDFRSGALGWFALELPAHAATGM